MFWKKEKTKPHITASDSQDQRDAYRYIFKDGQGLEITFKKNNIRILNLSAGGLAFVNRNFQPMDFDHVRVELDIPGCTEDTSFGAVLRIIKIDEDDICHCIFEGCTLEHHELLHKYVLEMQKRDLAH